MSFPFRRRWLLRCMTRNLRMSDPHLAVMLAIFARLTAGEAIASKEQAASPGAWARRGLARLCRAITRAAAALLACAGWVFRRAAGAGDAVRLRFSRAVRAAGV